MAGILQGPEFSTIGNIKGIEISSPISHNTFQGEDHLATVLSPTGWKSTTVGEEESDGYSLSWELANASDAGIAPYEELEFSLVTSDKAFLGPQKFQVYCTHANCNYSGWTSSEGTRSAAIVPKFMKIFNKDNVNSVPTNYDPGFWGINTASNFYVNFFPPAASATTLDGYIGTEYSGSGTSGLFVTDAFDPISRTITNGIASQDFIASFNFQLTGLLDANGDGTVSAVERANVNSNNYLMLFRSSSNNAISLSLKLTGEKSYVFQNYASGKTYSGDFPESFLERSPSSSKFWNTLKIETFRNGSISVVAQVSNNNPLTMISIPAAEGQVRTFNSIRVETKRPSNILARVDYRFDNFNISLKHNELVVTKLTDLNGNSVKEILKSTNYKLIGAGFKTSLTTPQLSFGQQSCNVSSFSDTEITFSCPDQINGYREVNLTVGSVKMEGKFYLNQKLRALIPLLHLLLE
jgi:hypothetical protein